MSSLYEIKKELEQIDVSLLEAVNSLIAIEDSLASQNARVETYKKHKNRLVRALAILEGTEVEEVPTAHSVAQETNESKSLPASTPKPRGRPPGAKNKPKKLKSEIETFISKEPDPDRPFIRKVRQVDPEMVCKSCGGEMVRTLKTLGNGKQIALKICEECSNEVYT